MSSITINSNIASLNAQRRLGQSTASLQTSFTRLSSGLRINKASDDASGLAISSDLNVDARVYSQAIRNVNDGISMLAIAEGALSELSTITQRQLELAEQAANGVLSLEQRKALDAEANALVDEFNRIVESVSFNGRQLIDVRGATVATRIQAGYGQNGGLELDLGGFLAQGIGDGTFQTAQSFATSTAARNVEVADFNNDGHLDVANIAFGGNSEVFLGRGNGTFKAGINLDTISDRRDVEVGDFNRDGNLDLVTTDLGDPVVNVFLGNGDGTFSNGVSIATGSNAFGVDVADVNQDGIEDIINVASDDDTFFVNIGVGDGSFKAGVSYATASGTFFIELADVNGDNILDAATSHNGLGFPTLSLGNGDGSFRAPFSTGALSNGRTVDIDDINHDGYNDLVYAGPGGNVQVLVGNGDGSFKARVTYPTAGGSEGVELVDMNGDGILDIVSAHDGGSLVNVLLGNGDGTFGASTSVSVLVNPNNIQTGDINGDGAIDIITPSFTVTGFSILFGNAIESSQIGQLSLLSQEKARDALPQLRAQLDRIVQEKGNIGSFQSRLQTAVSKLRVDTENVRAAASQIVDADVAREAAELVRRNILQQAGAAVLAQANQGPALALALLG